MRQLYKHDLHASTALAFFKDALEQTNLLSIDVIKCIELNKGVFFTFLPKEADLNRLHQFDCGILPEMPRQKGPVGNLLGMYDYSNISSLEEEFCAYLVNEITRSKFYCVIDDFNSSYEDSFCCDLFDKFGKHYEKEIYYFIHPQKASHQNILECLYRSKTFWHSLCVVTNINLDESIRKKIDQDTIKEICANAQLVMIGAYDGEGYIFWERISTDETRSAYP